MCIFKSILRDFFSQQVSTLPSAVKTNTFSFGFHFIVFISFIFLMSFCYFLCILFLFILFYIFFDFFFSLDLEVIFCLGFYMGLAL